MNEEIFRKKNLDKMKSPENLNEYIRVASPGVWLLLAAVTVLLAGACIWGVFGHIESTVTVGAYVENGGIYCLVDREKAEAAQVGAAVRIEGTQGLISEPGTWDGDHLVCRVTAEQTLPDGSYTAQLVTESIRPVSFLLN